MYQGFYNLTSGMLTQSRNLNVISNNMVNVQTSGYKRDTMVTSTFQEEMLYRTGRHNKANPTPLSVTSKIKTASRTYVDYDQGSFEQTDGIYDFAIGGSGFFCIQTPDGERYTRNGSSPCRRRAGCFRKTASPYGLMMRTSAWMPGAVLRCMKDRQIQKRIQRRSPSSGS